MHPGVKALFKKALQHRNLKRLFVNPNEVITDPRDIEMRRADAYSGPVPAAWVISDELSAYGMQGSCGNHGQHSVQLKEAELTKYDAEWRQAENALDEAKLKLARRRRDADDAVSLAIARYKSTDEYVKLEKAVNKAHDECSACISVVEQTMPRYYKGAWFTREEIKQLLKEEEKRGRTRKRRKA